MDTFKIVYGIRSVDDGYVVTRTKKMLYSTIVVYEDLLQHYDDEVFFLYG